ncbi:hypothetical protein Pla175_48330 [Pirellulimonas nuda]|uniref:SLA1 homology domain-containing protein n=1 Tax=Pirellulimonas nuda TaxID=2528009 RepID=A0A518DIW5_9BACT|nr:SHD1 domain-containing protein [Pirellulimonas nuda]QDU91410.1 hypothetical protein Pla175_48330 [Pirellulimonas nuda]
MDSCIAWGRPTLRPATSCIALLLALASLVGAPTAAEAQDDSAVVEFIVMAPRGAAEKKEVDDSAIVDGLIKELQLGTDWFSANAGADVFFGKSNKAGGEPDVTQLVTALVKLAAPDQITSTRTVSINGRVGTRVAPVSDFEVFCAAIDYGRVLERNNRERYVKVRIQPEEITKEALEARAQAVGRSDVVDELFSQDGPRGMGLAGRGFGGFGRGFDGGVGNGGFGDGGFGDRGLGGGGEGEDKFGVGDRVEISIAGKWYRGVVEAEPKFKNTMVAVDDLERLAAAVSSRALKTQLERRSQLRIVAPEGYLRRATGPAPGVGGGGGAAEPRQWSDASGRFSVTATFVSEADGVVTLRKQSGDAINVPVAKLCEADQNYLAGVASGATGGAGPAGLGPVEREAKVLAVDRRNVRPFDKSGLREWRFDPPPSSPPLGERESYPTVDLAAIPGSQRFFERASIFVSLDGKRVIVSRQKGGVGGAPQPFLHMVDPPGGRVTPLVAGPPGTKVLDALADRAVVLMKSDGSGAGSKVYVQRMTATDLQPVIEWEPYPSGRGQDRARDVDYAWFLPGNRVLTVSSRGCVCTVWKLGAAAVAEYEIALGVQIPHVIIGPQHRLLAIGSDEKITVFDLSEGRVVGSVEANKGERAYFHSVNNLRQIAFSSDLKHMAVLRDGALATWDMATGEMVSELWHSGIGFSSSIEWVGDFVLLDGKHVFDPLRRVLLWEYTADARFFAPTTTVASGRMWFIPSSKSEGATFLGSTVLPDEQVQAMAESLGPPESLLLAKPGDEVSIRIDVDEAYGSVDEVRQAVTKQLTAAGYTVVDGPTQLVAFAECRKMQEEKQIRINVGGNAFPEEQDIVTRWIRPALSRVGFEANGEAIWIDGGSYDVWGNIYLEEGESLDDALERLTTPDIRRVLSATFASYVARQGNVGSDKAYGTSDLADGLFGAK